MFTDQWLWWYAIGGTARESLWSI